VRLEITGLTGDGLLVVLATLANPHRLRIVATLAEERNYVSRLARELETGAARFRCRQVGMIFQFFNLLDDLEQTGHTPANGTGPR
jgi:predicted ABC-type transport system involved in lysophospholipase L1 biosynthesis ATPase subunit